MMLNKVRYQTPKRTHSGNFRKTNKSNKKYLAKDFFNCCGYCGDHNRFLTDGAYHVDHFAPKDKFPDLIFQYENLIYACPFCNRSKSNKWCGRSADENIVNGIGFIDPCSDEYETHLYRNHNGEICYFESSTQGKYMYEELNLYLIRHKHYYQMNRLYGLLSKLKKELDEPQGHVHDTKNDKMRKIYNELAGVFVDHFIDYCEFDG